MCVFVTNAANRHVCFFYPDVFIIQEMHFNECAIWTNLKRKSIKLFGVSLLILHLSFQTKFEWLLFSIHPMFLRKTFILYFSGMHKNTVPKIIHIHNEMRNYDLTKLDCISCAPSNFHRTENWQENHLFIITIVKNNT